MKLLEIKEGLGTFLVPFPKSEDEIPRRTDEVFFNIHQEINRDFSVLALRAYAEETRKKNLTVCEPLCGSGIRSIRYILETPTSSIYSNDLNPNAIDVSRKNIARLPTNLAKKITLSNQECNNFLHTLNGKQVTFDFIDIDPYGTPIPFVHNSIQLANLGGLLAFTATDLASLVGLYPRALYAKYGVNLHNSRIGNVHEIAARALITGIQHIGLTLEQSLIPVLTFYYRHFIRCFLIRKRGVNKVIDQTGFINKCQNCNTRFTSPIGEKNAKCDSCNIPVRNAIGPLYLGQLQQIEYLSYMLKDEHLQNLGSRKRLKTFLSRMIEEISIDVPWSFEIPDLAKKVGTPVPPMSLIKTKLTEIGFNCVKTHFSGASLKTNANENEVCSVISSLKSKRIQ